MCMNSRLKRWTLEEDERLKSMILAGCPPGNIAFKLHRSISAVYSRAHHLHLSFKRADTKVATGPKDGDGTDGKAAIKALGPQSGEIPLRAP